MLCGGIVGLALIGLIIVSLQTMTDVNKGLDSTTSEATKMNAIQDAGTLVDNIYLQMFGMAAGGDMASKQEKMARIEKDREEYKKAVTKLKEEAKTKTGKDLLLKLDEALAGARDINNPIIEMTLAHDGIDSSALDLLVTKSIPYMQANVDPVIEEIITWREKRIKETEATAEASISQGRTILISGGIFAILIAGFLSIIVSGAIAPPLKGIRDFTQTLAHGDFSKELPQAYLLRKDEIGDLAQGMQTMVSNTRELLHEITHNSQSVASAATELSAVSTQIAGNSQELSVQTTTVASAAEQASTNIRSIAAAAEQMSSSVNTVAAAIEEMSASVKEVAKSSQMELQASSEASKHAQSGKEIMDRLGAATNSIGKMIDMINDVAEQTNLLALNATIEAATAGEAGKGFAVVASEVKELAKQTAQATQEIEAQIDEMSSNTKFAIDAIQKIVTVIDEVNHISQAVMRAVGEQSATIGEIAMNVSGVSGGARDVARNVSESAAGLTQIAGSIHGASSAVRETTIGVTQVKESAEELARLSEGLKALVGKFKV